MFLQTTLLDLKIAFHYSFEKVNLRFYRDLAGCRHPAVQLIRGTARAFELDRCVGHAIVPPQQPVQLDADPLTAAQPEP